MLYYLCFLFFFSSRRRHTRWPRDWSSDVCSSDLLLFDVPVDDFNTSLWDPLGEYLRDLGVTIQLAQPVEALHQRNESWQVTTARDHTEYDAVVLAADRSEERRVGKERGCGGRRCPSKKKHK